MKREVHDVRCENCGYYYCDTDEQGDQIGFPNCHFKSSFAAPCEVDDYEEGLDDLDDEIFE